MMMLSIRLRQLLYVMILLLSLSLQQSSIVMASIIDTSSSGGGGGLGVEKLSSQQQLLSPIFIDEPPSRISFANSTGTVISCSATSSISSVKIWWINADSQTIVQEITGIRYIRPNGQLVFPPFDLDQYRQDVHSTVCF